MIQQVYLSSYTESIQSPNTTKRNYNYVKYIFIQVWVNSTASRVLALHTTNPNLFNSFLYGPPALPQQQSFLSAKPGINSDHYWMVAKKKTKQKLYCRYMYKNICSRFTPDSVSIDHAMCSRGTYAVLRNTGVTYA